MSDASAAQRHRVTLDEVDAAGVVFAPTLIALAHRAYEQAALERGLDLAALVRAREIALPVVRVECDFHAPSRHGDELTLAVSCARVGGSSYALTIALRGAVGDARATVTQVHACVDPATGRSTTLPEWLRALLTTWTA